MDSTTKNVQENISREECTRARRAIIGDGGAYGEILIPLERGPHGGTKFVTLSLPDLWHRAGLDKGQVVTALDFLLLEKFYDGQAPAEVASEDDPS